VSEAASAAISVGTPVSLAAAPDLPPARDVMLEWRVMTPRQRDTFEPVTLGHLRGHGCRDLLVYYESVWCNHSALINADWLSDETPLQSLCPKMVCTACGGATTDGAYPMLARQRADMHHALAPAV
jgi:hypothetical protein